MPSTTSSSVSSDFASSIVITPSFPTFFMASARKRPISASPFAEMVPTWAISSFEVTFLEFFCRSTTTASTARSTPRLRSIGFMPAATALMHSLTIRFGDPKRRAMPSRGLLARLDLGQHPHDVAFLHDQVLDVIDLDLGSGPLAEQHAVVGLDVDGNEIAALVAPSGTDRDHL